MIFKATLSNPQHPEYGAATIPFPIPVKDYDSARRLLAGLGIGDAVAQDCQVEELNGGYHVLKRLEGQSVNMDELDYLAKRLDGFTVGEDDQFQAMAAKNGYTRIGDLINLTFCCQQATVITDFSNLEQIGKDHALIKNGGSMPVDQLEQVDGRQEALDLILNAEGTVTPYGVVYDNGMELEQLYRGKEFPAYLYDTYELVLAVTPKGTPEEAAEPTYLYLPSTECQISRALQRGGMSGCDNVQIKVELNALPDGVCAALKPEREPLGELNRMCAAIAGLDKDQRARLDAAALLTGPASADQVTRLVRELDLFDFAPDVHTPEDLGKYMIQQSGHYEYDENLESFYDYGKLGRQRMDEHPGQFTRQGYISYEGMVPLDELLGREPTASSFQMGGLA